YANIKDLSIVSTDGESKLANSVSNNLAQVLEVVRGTTGIDLSDLVSKAQNQGGTAPTTGGGRDGSTTFDDAGDFSGSGSAGGGADDNDQVVEGEISEGHGSQSGRGGRSGRGGAKPSGLGDPSAWSGGNFDPKDYLDENGELDLTHIGDDVKKATGIDVQSYIAEALRRRDGRDGDSDGSGGPAKK
ncbi:MAG: flotillin, partial [Brevibacterium aurantiacum]|nr:flotillin [Brevibacterium aurantiacum]